MKKKSRRHFGRPALCSLAVALSLSVTGCGLSGTAPKMGTADIGTKIYVIGQASNVQFWENVELGAREAGEELGYDVVYRCADTIMDYKQQRKFIREAISNEAKCIVIAPTDPDELTEELTEAVNAGIEIITIDSDTNFTGRRAYIGSINTSVGAIAARQAAEYFTDFYNDKALVVTESRKTNSIDDRLSGFIPALIGTVRSKATEVYAKQVQADAMAELETSDLPPEVLNPAKSSASIAAAANAPEEALARAVANATVASAVPANIDAETAAAAAKLAVNAYGGNGDLAASMVMEMMTGVSTDTSSGDTSDETVAKVNAAAEEAVKAVVAKGGSTDEITQAATKAAAEAAISLGADPGVAARAAGSAAGTNGGDGMAASSAAAEMVAQASGEADQNNAQQANAQQGNAAGDPAETVQQAAQSAAKAAASQGAPPAAIADAAAKAAASAAISVGADPGVAAQAAGQAAGMNGGDSQAASSAAAEAVANAAGDQNQEQKADNNQAKLDGVPQEVVDAAQAAAKSAASQGAPAAAIEQAAANAAATTAIQVGADANAAAQAAGQAAGMNGADGQAAGAAAAEMVTKALEENAKPDTEKKDDDKASTIQSGNPINSIAPVKEVINCDGDSDTAKSEIIKQLSGKDGENIKVIFTTSERSTIGACEAVNDLNLVGKVAIIGFNTNDDELTYLKNGTLSGVIVRNPYNMGYLGVYYAGRLIAGENVGAVIDTGATYATLANLNSNEIRLMLDPAGYTRK